MQENNGLDRRQLILFMIFSFIMIGSMFYFQRDSNTTAEATTPAKTANTNNQSTIQLNTAASAAQIVPQTLQNEELKIEVSPVGGQITSVQLPKYSAYNTKTDNADLPLFLFNKNNSNYGFQFHDKAGKVINTKDLIFTPSVNGNVLTMTAKVNDATVQMIYSLMPHYTVDFQVRSQGLSAVIKDQKANFNWDYSVRTLEKGRSQEQAHTEFVYTFDNYSEYDWDQRTTMDETGETLNWLGVKQQFFAAVIEPQMGFKQSVGNQDIIETGEFIKKYTYTGSVDLPGGEFNQGFKWYFMPLDLELLKKHEGKSFVEILPLGWSFIGSMNRYFFIPAYNFIASWGLSAGWAIFVLTILVKLILSPIMFKQHKLSAMMKIIRPEIDEVNTKYKDADPMKRQQAVMEVYRKAGVNQLAGCLPGLLQIPIFYALFRFFPNFIDLRGEHFWFVKDLTAYDDLIKLPFHIPFLGEHISIFALACTIVILIYTRMTSGNISQVQQPGMPNMKVLMYIFPITFLFFFNSYASGLSWYYFVSNALNIVIILVIKYFILDEKKIHAQIQANKAQPKKEGKFQRRMREMMEKAQEQQRLQQEQMNRNKKK
ncbi:membrane protein insertase YidC [Bergeyella zoohelcum]|uniref:membrane protein insertase YidC n=1 Tax=Bergeyella zoohelcum TaxID=1015 RepID=UPI00373549F6